jgi:hypothetical protein
MKQNFLNDAILYHFQENKTKSLFNKRKGVASGRSLFVYLCVCLSVCLSDSAHATIGWLKFAHPTSNMVFAFIYTNVKSPYLYTGCMGEIQRVCTTALA